MASVKSLFFDVKEAKNGQPFLVISQIKSWDEGQYRQSVVIFPDQIPGLTKAVKECVARFKLKLTDQVDKLAAAGAKVKGQVAG